MRLRMSWGELALALFFMAAGVVWCVLAMQHPMWSGRIPDSGFLPLAYGVLLVVLSALVIVGALGKGDAVEAGPPVARGLVVLLVFAAGVIGIEPVGFLASMFAMQLFLYAVVERKPLLLSLVVALASALFMKLVFQTWLGVPLPRGPWGF